MRLSMSRRDFVKWATAQAVALATAERAASAPEWKALDKKGKPKKVLVIGAGLAGLAAAHELTQVGHDVTILEASLRAGGRVHTIRQPFSDGLHAEAGALHIPATHEFTLRYVRHFQLPLVTYPEKDRGLVYYLGGNRINFQPNQPIVWPLPLTAAEQRLGLSGMYQQYLQPAIQAIGDPDAVGWPGKEARKYDEVSLAELLKSKGASPAAEFLLALGNLEHWGDGRNSLSALTALRELKLHFSDVKQYCLKGGNDRLPTAFAAQLKARIRYGSPVVALHQDAQEARVTIRGAGEQRTFKVDRVVCTLPFSVLRTVDGIQQFSAAKQKAIEELPYSSVMRLHLQSRTRFWDPLGKTVTAVTDLPVMTFYDDALGEPGPRGVLSCYVTGRPAEDLGKLGEDKRLGQALTSMKKVFPELAENYEGGATYFWNDNPWARGAYAWFKPGQLTSLLPHMAAAEGRIHFAGEHTSPWPAWMQGALYSGYRAAHEVNDAP